MRRHRPRARADLILLVHSATLAEASDECRAVGECDSPNILEAGVSGFPIRALGQPAPVAQFPDQRDHAYMQTRRAAVSVALLGLLRDNICAPCRWTSSAWAQYEAPSRLLGGRFDRASARRSGAGSLGKACARIAAGRGSRRDLTC
jgi:hypothetical protein